MNKLNFFHKIKIWNKKNKLLFLSLILIFVFGLFYGMMMVSNLSVESTDNLSLLLNNVFVNLKAEIFLLDANIFQLFIECFIKYSKSVVVIWLLAFFPPALLFVFIILFFKGVSLGFTTSFLFSLNELYSFSVISSLYLLQNLLIVPIYIYISYSSISFIYNNIKGQLRKNNFEEEIKDDVFTINYIKKLFRYSMIFNKESFYIYLKSLFVSLFFVLIVTSIECFLTPLLV